MLAIEQQLEQSIALFLQRQRQDTSKEVLYRNLLCYSTSYQLVYPFQS